jgi:hypothetical protein
MRLNDGEPALSPQNFLIQTLHATWDNLPQVLVGMLWFNLCLAPSFVLAVLGLGGLAAAVGVLLAAPGWVALQHFESGLVQGRAVPLASLLSSFRRFWRPSVRLGVLAIALPAVIWFAGARLNAAATPALALGGAVSLLVVSLLALYAVPLLVMYNQELGVALRNSLVLSARHINNTIGMVALAVLCGLLVFYLNSGLVFVLPALYGMFVINNCRLVIGQEG